MVQVVTILFQTRQTIYHMYDVTLGLVRPILVSVEEQKNITYSECVSIALGIQHPILMHRIAVWPAPLYSIFPHYFIKDAFSKKKKIVEHKTCVLMSSTHFDCNISCSENKFVRYDQKCVSAFM